jgi:hypothetical protein
MSLIICDAMLDLSAKARSSAGANKRDMSSYRFLVLICSVALAGTLGCAKSASDAGPSSSPQASAAANASPQASMQPFLGTHFPAQGHKHFADGESTNFDYNSDPPTSGPHREIFNDAFVSPTPLPKYVQVHLLEHGNVLLQYNCNCPDIAGALAQIAYRYNSQLVPPNRLQPLPQDVQAGEEGGMAVLVAPYPGMKHKIALTAWTRLATLDAIDEQKITSFINAYLHNQTNLSQ